MAKHWYCRNWQKFTLLVSRDRMALGGVPCCRTRPAPLLLGGPVHIIQQVRIFLQQLRCAINVTVLYLSKIKLNLTLIP